MSNIFQDIKDRVDLKDLVRYYGLDVDYGGFACCPFHIERHPSFKVYEDHYHCFGCGEHGDHIDFVQKIYELTNIEAAKKISSDFGLGLDKGNFAVPVKRPKPIDELKVWRDKAVPVVSDYCELLRHWEKIYTPRSPIDNVNERYLESVHKKGYAEFYLRELQYGSRNDLQCLYDTDREYSNRIKERLDRLDSISRKPFKKAIQQFGGH